MLRRPPSSTLFPHDALPISSRTTRFRSTLLRCGGCGRARRSKESTVVVTRRSSATIWSRSEEHTSELQSRFDIVCRLLLEKKNNHTVSLSAHYTKQRYDK